MMFASIGLLGLMAAQGALLVVHAAPEQGCPSGAQVSDALTARMPGAVLDVSESPGAHGGIHVVELSGEPGRPLLSVVDPAGAHRLQRALDPGETGQKDCAALADTVAIIVERYLADLGILAAAATPPAVVVRDGTDAAVRTAVPAAVAAPSQSRHELALVPQGRTGHDGLSALALYLEGRRYFDVPFVMFRAGAFGPGTLAWQDPSGGARSGTLSGGRAELAAGLCRESGGGRIEAVAGLGVEVLSVREGSADHWGVGQDLSAGAGYTVRLPRSLFARVEAAAHLAITRHAIRALAASGAPGGEILVETPRVFATLGFALGVAF